MKRLSLFFFALSILGSAPAQGMSSREALSDIGAALKDAGLSLAATFIAARLLPPSMRTEGVLIGIGASCYSIISLESLLGLRRALFSSSRQSLIDDVVPFAASDYFLHRFVLTHLLGVNARNTNGRTALMLAARFGEGNAAQRLLKAGADIEAVDGEGMTPLAIAGINGNNALVQILLQANANPDHVYADAGERLTSLYAACVQGEHDIVATLLAHRANTNLCTHPNRLTALMAAAATNRGAIVDMLLRDDRTQINDTDAGNNTALIYAIEYRHPDIVIRLLRHNGLRGVDRELRDHRGYNALHRATLNERDLPDAHLTEAVEALLHPGAAEETAAGAGAGAGAALLEYAHDVTGEDADEDTESAHGEESESDSESEGTRAYTRPQRIDLGFDVNARVRRPRDE